MKIKYWTVVLSERGTVIATGDPETSLRRAIAAKARLHSSRACVVRSNERGFPGTEVVA